VVNSLRSPVAEAKLSAQFQPSSIDPQRQAVLLVAGDKLNYCIDNKIGTVVFGWNQGQKDGSNMGKKNNHKNTPQPLR
jgi:hypothetical protein